jgi:glucan phosphoethanolaminetransferase (alkaline phosphatase superfamily)
MIQRIQSLWLLLASLSVLLLFFFPVATLGPNANGGGVIVNFYAHNLNSADAFPLIYPPFLKWTVVAVVSVCLLTPFVSIFMYRNRARQVQLSRLTILLNAALTVAFFLLADAFAKPYGSSVGYGVGIYVPLAAIIFLLLAIRFIKKDDKLVRSADRIR